MSRKTDLQTSAIQVRKYLLSHLERPDNFDFAGHCDTCADELKEHLDSRAIECRVVDGLYKYFDKELDRDLDINRHFWVDTGDYIIDISREQFSNPKHVINPIDDILIPKDSADAKHYIDPNQTTCTPGQPLILCDSEQVEFRVGDKVRHFDSINKDMHGEWVDYEVKMQGSVPILLYLQSESGRVLPKGGTGGPLSNIYDSKEFIFAKHPVTLLPDERWVIQRNNIQDTH